MSGLSQWWFHFEKYKTIQSITWQPPMCPPPWKESCFYLPSFLTITPTMLQIKLKFPYSPSPRPTSCVLCKLKRENPAMNLAFFFYFALFLFSAIYVLNRQSFHMFQNSKGTKGYPGRSPLCPGAPPCVWSREQQAGSLGAGCLQQLVEQSCCHLGCSVQLCYVDKVLRWAAQSW